ncbi:hypothetical protein NX801_08320 [Streptomyces sp. LP05-1]|uniref:Uncharacterized protein n=1 Tax=Streptomyces pyxinae TaxID=2970734 RepID=A0ABT2CE32_9ACTN|nr:hypothetical protein [Streptomyces sp. LP05-1]MCS0635668.1 hypothetical protein [Streptomyces sp. LP05-1]
MPSQSPHERQAHRIKALNHLSDIRGAYESGTALTVLARQYAVRCEWLRERLVDDGVEIRDRGEANRARALAHNKERAMAEPDSQPPPGRFRPKQCTATKRWLFWTGDTVRQEVLAWCPDVNADQGEVCGLYAGHPSAHGCDVIDPAAEALRESLSHYIIDVGWVPGPPPRP